MQIGDKVRLKEEYILNEFYTITNEEMIIGIVRDIKETFRSRSSSVFVEIRVEVLKHKYKYEIGKSYWVNIKHFEKIGQNNNKDFHE